MTPRARKALKGSIRKWEKIVTGDGEDMGDINCPLCREYNNEKTPDDKCCKGCPVSKATGEGFCVGTPYQAFEKAKSGEYDGFANTIESRRAALAMLRFLESLQ